MLNRVAFILLLFAVLAIACSRQPDARLVLVAEMVSDKPEDALAALDSINKDELSAADRHYYDFLTIKGSDKAYITHTSDSLILDVVNYYEGTDLYPEALYYGGRVYSDLGDYPTALDYFQRGLDEVGETTPENIDVKGNLLSQTARLLNTLRLYSQAVPYMKEVLTIDSLERDTFNLAYDHQLLGAIYMHQDSLSLADKQFKTAVKYAKHLPSADQADMELYVAIAKYKQGDSILSSNMLKKMPGMVNPSSLNLALSYASDIYLDEGNLDSAYYCAKRLVNSDDDNNRKHGYLNLFHSNLYRRLPSDSLPIYIRDFYNTLEKYYNSHESQSALMQNTFYNYQIQQKKREKAELRTKKYIYICACLTIIIFLFIIVMLVLRARKQALRISLQSTIIKLDELREALESKEILQSESNLDSSYDIDKLRKQIITKVEHLRNKPQDKAEINDTLIKSEVYKQLQSLISSNNCIPNESPIWAEIEHVILLGSPQFKVHLDRLKRKNIKRYLYQIILLIRCGVTPTQMAILLSCSKSTITYRRQQAAETIFGLKVESQYIDELIRYL